MKQNEKKKKKENAGLTKDKMAKQHNDKIIFEANNLRRLISPQISFFQQIRERHVALLFHAQSTLAVPARGFHVICTVSKRQNKQSGNNNNKIKGKLN